MDNNIRIYSLLTFSILGMLNAAEEPNAEQLLDRFFIRSASLSRAVANLPVQQKDQRSELEDMVMNEAAMSDNYSSSLQRQRQPSSTAYLIGKQKEELERLKIVDFNRARFLTIKAPATGPYIIYQVNGQTIITCATICSKL